MSARGAITATLGGREVKLLMTIGALAEVEEELGVKSIDAAIDLVSSASVRATIVMFAALARAAGNPMEREEIDRLDFMEVGQALAGAIAATFSEEAGAEGDGDAQEDEAKNP